MKKLNLKTITSLTILISVLGTPALSLAQDVTPASAITVPVLQSQQSTIQLAPVPQQLNFNSAKILLLQLLDRLNTHFEQTKQETATLLKTASSQDVDVTPVIDGYLARIQDLKTKAQKAQNPADLKAVAQDVRSLIQQARQQVKKNISKRVSNRITQFTQKAQTQPLIQLAQRRLTTLQNEGKNVEQVSTQLQDCQNLVQQGKQTLLDAQDEFNQIQDTDSSEDQQQSRQLMLQGLKKVKDARTTYMQARESCINMFKQLKSLR